MKKITQQSVSQPTGVQQPRGTTCPVCRGFVPISVAQLLHDDAIMCPHCGLSISVNRSSSQPAMDALKKVEKAIDQVRKIENFKR